LKSYKDTIKVLVSRYEKAIEENKKINEEYKKLKENGDNK
jgi:hypothetical protein